jgi:hypothetical protein
MVSHTSTAHQSPSHSHWRPSTTSQHKHRSAHAYAVLQYPPSTFLAFLCLAYSVRFIRSPLRSRSHVGPLSSTSLSPLAPLRRLPFLSLPLSTYSPALLSFPSSSARPCVRAFFSPTSLFRSLRVDTHTALTKWSLILPTS